MSAAENVVSLVPNLAVAPTQELLADRLEQFAARVRAGEFDDLERVVLITDGPSIEWYCYGMPCTLVEVVGTIEWAKSKIIRLGCDR